jgi:hypothetical protein
MNVRQPWWTRSGLAPVVLLALPLSACGPLVQRAPQTERPPAARVAERRPLYAATDEQPDPLAVRFCEALHALPRRRKAECCGTNASPGLTGECARILTTTLRDGAVRIDARAVDRCVEDAVEQLDGCDWVSPLPPAPPPSCRGILAGQLDAGQRCRSTLECREGLICRGVRPSTAGVCGPPSAVGETCSAAVDTLVTYTRQPSDDPQHRNCLGFCLRGQCSTLAAIGEPCLSNQQCGPGAHCAAGRCASGPPPTIGQPCERTICEGGSACVDGTCTALKPSGEPCTSPFECQGACIRAAGAPTGTCGMQCTGWVPPASEPPPAAPPYPGPAAAKPKP